MKIECFLDTNVLIYAAMGRRSDPAKRQIAARLIKSKNFAISAQVLSEFALNAAHPNKGATPLRPETIDRWLLQLQSFPVQTIDVEIVTRGVHFARRYQIKHWDAMLIAAAERLGAPILYTEDLSHEQFYGSVQVINPFRPN
jgi:predicted nucleic acid-binding protein